MKSPVASQGPLLLDGLLRAKREKGCEKKGFRVHAIDYEIYESKYMLFRKKTQANSGKVRNNRFGISEKKINLPFGHLRNDHSHSLFCNIRMEFIDQPIMSNIEMHWMNF